MEIAYTTFPNGENFWTAFKYNPSTQFFLAMGIAAILSMILADATLAWVLIFVFVYSLLMDAQIWRCWMVWGRSWRVVLVPIASATLAAGTFLNS